MSSNAVPRSGGYRSLPLDYFVTLAQVVQRVDCTVHWINHYPLHNSINVGRNFPLDGDLSSE